MREDVVVHQADEALQYAGWGVTEARSGGWSHSILANAAPLGWIVNPSRRTAHPRYVSIFARWRRQISREELITFSLHSLAGRCELPPLGMSVTEHSHR